MHTAGKEHGARSEANLEELLIADVAAAPRPPKIGFRQFASAYRRALPTYYRAIAIAVVTVLSVVILFLHLQTLTYTAQMTVAPNKTDSASSGDTGGALSSLIGIGGQVNDQFDQYMSIRDSNMLAARLMKIPGMPQKIFAGSWDSQNKHWRPPTGFISSLRRTLTGFLGFEAWAPPTVGDLALYLQKSVEVKTNRRSLITTFGYSDSDPEFAKSLLMAIHSETEAILSAQAQQRSRIMISHVLRELQVVTVAEQRAALIELLSSQEKRLMLVGDNLPYAAMVLDPASADRPDNRPRPLLTVIIALCLTLLVAGGWIAWRVLGNLKREKALGA